jgi:hypothetical protein
MYPNAADQAVKREAELLKASKLEVFEVSASFSS